MSYLVVSEDLPFIVIHKQYRDNRVKLSVNIGMPPFKNHGAGRTVLLAILGFARMEKLVLIVFKWIKAVTIGGSITHGRLFLALL